MRQLIIGILLVLALGVVGFLYRYEVEETALGIGKMASSVHTGGSACTADARVCPDGTAVGRTGPNCSFAVCAPPNVQISLPASTSTIAFVLPSGYSAASVSGMTTNSSLIGTYTKPGSGTAPNTISLYDYVTPAGETGEQVMLANTTFSPGEFQATTTDAFSTVQLDSQDFYAVTTNRSGGEVDSSYFILRSHDVLRFEIDEQGVSSSTDPSLNVSALPEHQSLMQMLATLQLTSP
jgi:hypothetical protein